MTVSDTRNVRFSLPAAALVLVALVVRVGTVVINVVMRDEGAGGTDLGILESFAARCHPVRNPS